MQSYFCLLVVLTCAAVGQAQFEVLHRSSTSVGQGRISNTAIDGATIYGLAQDSANSVNLFRVDLATSQFFSTALPTQSTQRLFGPDKAGRLAILDDQVIGSFSPVDNDVFSVNLDGTDFRIIANAEDVGLVFPQPISVGSRVFGSSERGVFSVNPDGSDLRLIAGEIEAPSNAQLVFDGDKIYGATWDSFRLSASDPEIEVGKLFSLNADGSEFATLRELTVPITSLDVANGKIYGIEDTSEGRRVGLPRNLFSMDTDGTDYEVLHEFEGEPADGANATQVVATEEELFGVTRTGGAENAGTLFRTELDGSNYAVIHNFGLGSNNGVFPNNDLVIIGSNLYGSTSEGGALDPAAPLGGGGIVYKVPISPNAIPEPQSVIVWLAFVIIGCCCCRQRIVAQ